MGEYLTREGKTKDSIVLAAYECGVPIFCPAFSDCSAGLGIVAHYHERGSSPKASFDSAKDFYELTQVKLKNPTTGLLMIISGWRISNVSPLTNLMRNGRNGWAATYSPTFLKFITGQTIPLSRIAKLQTFQFTRHCELGRGPRYPSPPFRPHFAAKLMGPNIRSR